MGHQNPDPLWQNAFHVTLLAVPTSFLGCISFPKQLSLLLQVCVSNQFLEEKDPGNTIEDLLNFGNIEYQQCQFSLMCKFFSLSYFPFFYFFLKTVFLRVTLARNSVHQVSLELTEIPLPLSYKCWD